MSRLPVIGLIILLICLPLLGCAASRPSPTPSLSGGILVTFDVNGETYRVFITNQETIEQVFAVQRGESQATIPVAS